MPEQIKKNPNDPDVDQINKEIVTLARSHAFLRGPFIMFLEGQLTWLEALESMVLLMTKEYREQNKILIATLQDIGPQLTLMLDGHSLIKAIPKTPLSLDWMNTQPILVDEEESDESRLAY